MNATTLREHLARLDAALGEPARLCIYGSAALMLMGEEDRFSLDIDVAGSYSVVSERTLATAAQQIGLPINPPEHFTGDHIYRMPTMLGRFRERLGGAEPIPAEVPAWMVRDIGLPLFSRVATPASKS